MSNRSFANSVILDQASGWVCIQAHCSFTEAATLMRDRARETNQSLDEVARAVLDRSITFST